MAETAGGGVRLALLALGVAAVGGAYAIWTRSQPDEAVAVADPPAAVVAAPGTDLQAPDTAATVDAPPAEVEVAEPLAVEVADAPPSPPAFDVVRIEPDGAALIAGTAPADARVSIRLDGVEEIRTQAGSDGAFVAQFTLAPNPAPRLMGLVVVLEDGTEIAGTDTVAIAPIIAAPPATAAADPAPPAALLLTDEGAEVIQGPAPIAPGEEVAVALDAIAYAPDGAVQLAGRGQGGSALRFYLDNAPLSETVVGEDGKWAVTLPDVTPGIYTLRVDQLAADGAVTSRFETPFKREALAAVAAPSVPDAQAVVEAPAVVAEAAPVAPLAPYPPPVPDIGASPVLPEADVAAVPEPAPVIGPTPEPVIASPEPDATPVVVPVPEPVVEVTPAPPEPVVADAPPPPVTVTVQPGFTLWQIATDRFGEGTMYVQVFEANRDSIKDPDLIYPGQVFTLPQE